ncbi:MAG: hypothetical protein R2879_15830 [Saprospiraceae bacterium]
MIKNMIVFTLILGVATLALEYFRKGTIAIEDPAGFGITILIMGIAGGYIYNWTYEKTKK